MYIQNEKLFTADKGVAVIDDIRTNETDTHGALSCNIKRFDEQGFRGFFQEYEKDTKASILERMTEVITNTLEASLADLDLIPLP